LLFAAAASFTGASGDTAASFTGAGAGEAVASFTGPEVEAAAGIAGATGERGAAFTGPAEAAVDSSVSGASLRLRGGLVLVSSLGEQNIVSREPAGLTLMNSPCAGSLSETTRAERPGWTPTAVGVNQTVGGLPADNSASTAATSDCDSECTATNFSTSNAKL
jgi:hypothetical protein